MMKIILCLLLLLSGTNMQRSVQNSEESNCMTYQTKSSTILKYVKQKEEEWSSALKTIKKSVEEYISCSSQNCSCYLEVIARDLEPFKSGINENNIEDAEKLGTIYQILNHRLYRATECMFPNRCKGIEHFLLKILHKLPDTEFVINSKDWPMVSAYSPKLVPLFSFSKTKHYLDITYPAWSFWEGGPAIKLYPTGIGRWDLHRKSLIKEASVWPWEKKWSRGFFRGSRTSSERDNLVYLSRTEPSLVDAHFTKNQAWKSDADTLHAPPAEEVSFETHCRYKYLFNYRGVAASFRLKHLFLCGSLVFHVGDEWNEFFYSKLIPWVHYIPVSATASQEEIRDILNFAKENDKVAEEIATRGFQFVKDNLKMKDIFCYWVKLLKSYSKLLTYKPKMRNNVYEVKH